MPHILNSILLIFCATSIKTALQENVNKEIIFQKSYRPLPGTNNYQDNQDTYKSNKQLKRILNILPKAKSYIKKRVKIDGKTDYNNDQHLMDPVLNAIQRRARYTRRENSDTSSSSDASSSLELTDWKKEWKDHWKLKKIEAANASSIRGDVVNMVAARPWGVPCGDPNQHDIPWGTCMLPMECESEYRIYRGDVFCGRSQFVCCALALTTYDIYQGEYPSFEDSQLTTDSEEKRNRGKSKENNKKNTKKHSMKRKNQREKRKKIIKKNIRKVMKEIQKMLDRSYRNGTNSKQKKTKQLKKFVQDLKKRYKNERQAIKDINEIELIKIDDALMKRLEDIRVMNKNFISNATFRDIVVNGTVNKKGARMLIQAYPELTPYFKDITRRSEGGGPNDYLDYDIEYGMLYY